MNMGQKLKEQICSNQSQIAHLRPYISSPYLRSVVPLQVRLPENWLKGLFTCLFEVNNAILASYLFTACPDATIVMMMIIKYPEKLECFCLKSCRWQFPCRVLLQERTELQFSPVYLHMPSLCQAGFQRPLQSPLLHPPPCKASREGWGS